jgi:hypothetical protein
MNKEQALFTAGFVFAVVAIAHLARVFMGSTLLIGNFNMPVWLSIVAFFGAGSLSFWMFMSAKK